MQYEAYSSDKSHENTLPLHLCNQLWALSLSPWRWNVVHPPPRAKEGRGAGGLCRDKSVWVWVCVCVCVCERQCHRNSNGWFMGHYEMYCLGFFGCMSEKASKLNTWLTLVTLDEHLLLGWLWMTISQTKWFIMKKMSAGVGVLWGVTLWHPQMGTSGPWAERHLRLHFRICHTIPDFCAISK